VLLGAGFAEQRPDIAGGKTHGTKSTPGTGGKKHTGNESQGGGGFHKNKHRIAQNINAFGNSPYQENRKGSHHDPPKNPPELLCFGKKGPPQTQGIFFGKGRDE
jgi:hypothetical protein